MLEEIQLGKGMPVHAEFGAKHQHSKTGIVPVQEGFKEVPRVLTKLRSGLLLVDLADRF